MLIYYQITLFLLNFLHRNFRMHVLLVCSSLNYYDNSFLRLAVLTLIVNDCGSKISRCEIGRMWHMRSSLSVPTADLLCQCLQQMFRAPLCGYRDMQKVNGLQLRRKISKKDRTNANKIHGTRTKGEMKSTIWKRMIQEWILI